MSIISQEKHTFNRKNLTEISISLLLSLLFTYEKLCIYTALISVEILKINDKEVYYNK